MVTLTGYMWVKPIQLISPTIHVAAHSTKVVSWRVTKTNVRFFLPRQVLHAGTGNYHMDQHVIRQFMYVNNNQQLIFPKAVSPIKFMIHYFVKFSDLFKKWVHESIKHMDILLCIYYIIISILCTHCSMSPPLIPITTQPLQSSFHFKLHIVSSKRSTR